MNKFPEDYSVARDEFVSASKNALSYQGMKSIEHPLKGIKDNPLTVDIAWFGSLDADQILIQSSALHGVEGFAGSRIQSETTKSETLERLKSHQAVIQIHALNPHGFENMRRVNEDNIDLNRNFLDWQAALPAEHPLNQKVQKVLCPTRWIETLTLAKTFALLATEGLNDVKAALQNGQFSDPRGLFYGGDSEAWSNTVLRETISDIVTTAKPEHIIHLDIHTGLGKRGHAELLVPSTSSSGMYKRANKIWGSFSVTPMLADETSVQSVSASSSGSIEKAYSEVLDNGILPKLTLAGLEFGTVSPIKAAMALAFDNWVYSDLDRQTEKNISKTRTKMRQAFSPQDPLWEKSITDQGKVAAIEALENIPLL